MAALIRNPTTAIHLMFRKYLPRSIRAAYSAASMKLEAIEFMFIGKFVDTSYCGDRDSCIPCPFSSAYSRR